MAAESEACLFKKPNRNRNIRKRSEPDEPEGSEPRSVPLEMMRELQRQRQRSRGVSLALTAGQGGEEPANVEEEEEGHGLESTFTAQSDAGEVDPNMLKYIEEQMRREEAAAGDMPVAKPVDDEDGLYTTPAHLQGRLPAKEDNSELEDANRWLAGIMEVPVAAEDKMRAMEETDSARRGVIARANEPRGGGKAQMVIPTNFNSNFHQHRREHAELKQAGKGGKGGRGGGRGRGRGATDYQALVDFRRHDRLKRH
eukprot:CAMPEP_0119356424 /NCGR_PEP_ID=MMETSP1334-20130426/5028_1 /TAXON_ID=127549 /ORGANISM="Calcidiscus leptoporus, Strain RCC1130" /LENGTH=254 /DNA_ID=CAMNT_0007370451 /DNA_START=10 /DNA_END=774 /DNA_ORIENTATION=-